MLDDPNVPSDASPPSICSQDVVASQVACVLRASMSLRLSKAT
jgi:hypothetical protein